MEYIIELLGGRDGRVASRTAPLSAALHVVCLWTWARWICRPDVRDFLDCQPDLVDYLSTRVEDGYVERRRLVDRNSGGSDL